MKIHDISLPISRALAGWPGDTPFQFKLTADMRAGDSANVGFVQMSIHTGTHIDAPFHFDPEGATIDELPLEPFIGPAQVIDVSGHDLIGIEHFRGIDFQKTPRLLLHTGAWPDRTVFPKAIPVLEQDVPEFLGKNGVLLIGLDVPSFDPLDSQTLPRHRALAAHDIQLLESLNLANVLEGTYELIAIPLKLTGADGSPVRAILRGS